MTKDNEKFPLDVRQCGMLVVAERIKVNDGGESRECTMEL